MSAQYTQDPLRTWDDGKRCAECCNGERCDDPSHFDRRHCPHCKGTGWALWTEPGRADFLTYLMTYRRMSEPAARAAIAEATGCARGEGPASLLKQAHDQILHLIDDLTVAVVDDSEVVQTALLCWLTAVEHETRDQFTYHGQRVLGPHFDVDALAGLAQAGNQEVRS